MSNTTYKQAYLFGPMTGYAEDNRPAFAVATAKLRSMGLDVCSPSELDDTDPAAGRSWADYLRRDIPWVAAAGMGVALPGWRQSKGATLEATIMRTLGIPVFEYSDDGLTPVDPVDLPYSVHPVVVAPNAS
jgi:hypothetical protein